MEIQREVEFWVGAIKDTLAQLSESQVTILLVLLALVGLAYLLVTRKGPLLYRAILGVLAIGVLMVVFGLLVIGFCHR